MLALQIEKTWTVPLINVEIPNLRTRLGGSLEYVVSHMPGGETPDESYYDWVTESRTRR